MKSDEATRRLFTATRAGNVGDMQTALDAGAEIDAKDDLLQTPLHWAASLGRYHAIYMLLRNGADRTIKDARGLTAEEVVLARIKSALSESARHQDHANRTVRQREGGEPQISG